MVQPMDLMDLDLADRKSYLMFFWGQLITPMMIVRMQMFINAVMSSSLACDAVDAKGNENFAIILKANANL